MDDFDIEDIGKKQPKAPEDTIEAPSQGDAKLIQSVIESKDFENAIDLFGDDFINEIANNQQSQDIDLLKYIPQSYVDFKKYEKVILDFYTKIPNECKPEFARRLIMKLIYPLSSYQIEDILENLSSFK